MTSKIFADGQPYPLSRRAFLGWVMAGLGSIALLGRRSTPDAQPKQIGFADCDAAACLAIVARHWGKRINPTSLDIGTDLWAESLTTDVITAGKKIGFNVNVGIYRQADAHALSDAPGPWLTCWGMWDDARWIVVRGMKRNHLLIDSPSTGRRLIPWKEFRAQWHKPITLLLLP